MGDKPLKQLAIKELALFLGLLFFGFVIMPLTIYWVGESMLGEFAGYGFADFFGDLSAKIRGGDLTAWLFVLSPYLALQVLRLTLVAWRAAGKPVS